MATRNHAGAVVTADELVAAVERRAAARERVECARLVCEECARGDVPLFDPRRSRVHAAHALRRELLARFDREDLHRASHARTCTTCRAGSEELCRQLGAAAEADWFIEHRRKCRSGCRAQKGRPDLLCHEAKGLRDAMRRAACRGPVRRRELDATRELEYPDEWFHVEMSGRSLRCAATAIWLRGREQDVELLHAPVADEAPASQCVD